MSGALIGDTASRIRFYHIGTLQKSLFTENNGSNRQRKQISTMKWE